MAYSPGTLVNIAATPAAGYQFIGWSGDASGAQNPLVVTMTRNMRITAVFNPVPPSTYTIDLVVSTVSDVGVGGTVSKSPNLPFYSAGAEVQVTASANAGHAFTGWRRSGFGAANPLGVLMHSNREVVANFAQMSPSTTVLALGLPFTHNVPGTAGGSRGKVSNMGNSGTMHWQASPTVSWIQVNSSGNSIPRGGDNPLVLYFEENPTTSPRSGEVYVTAPGAQNSPQIYTIVQAAGLPRYSLTVAAENGIVTKSPDQSTYAQGSQVQVTATPAAGYIFTGWTGDLSGTQTPVTVTVDGNKSIAANFLWLRNPDLVPKFVLQDSIAFQGGRAAYGGSVSNRGADASAPFKLYYRISNSSVLPPTINVSGEAPFMDFPNIGAVTEVPLSGNLDIPSSLALGSYYVWFLVDPENKAGEQSSTRSNNNIALPISVLPDTSAPVVNIAVPAGGANVTTISSSIDVAGTATDNVAVAEITWNNDRGGNGTTQGTANWSISGITLLPGNNVINVSARDAAGNQTTVTVTVSYNAPDLTPPAVTIAFPSIESTFGTSDGQLNVSGIATDDRGVAVVTWTNNRGGNGSASGTAVWSVNGITLQAGLNVITVTATDAAGNAATDTVAVTYSQPPSQFWRLEHFGTADASGNAADLADPDEDGLVNMVEFFLNGNPNSSAGVSLPTVGIENGDLTLTYTRNKAAMTELAFAVEASLSLAGPWGTSGVTEEVLSEIITIEQIKSRLPTGPDSAKYLRLRIVRP